MYKIITNKPIALDSPDHLMPMGIAQNNTRNYNFNKKIYKLFPSPINILDIGCAGGGFIKDCVDDGHNAIGIDGSDYRRQKQLPEWNTIPDNLFTCDVTEPFQVIDDDNIKFDIITAWEVLEHFKENSLDTFFNNIRNHLAENGIFIISINVATEDHKKLIPDDFGIGMHHQNIQDINWWDNKLHEYGFQNDIQLIRYFNNDFIRGPGNGCDDKATEERMLSTKNTRNQWATINRCLTR